MRLSHPAHAVRLMLEHKGLDHEVKTLVSGMHPFAVRAAGFGGKTVPALKLGGRRLQNSREIARELDELQPDRPLFPADPEARAAVEEAEKWGEHDLQPVPRLLFRWGVSNNRELREWMGREVERLPAAGLSAWFTKPVAAYFARDVGAHDEAVRYALVDLPGKLDRVDELIAAGVLAGPELNAADFQIGTSVRTLMSFADLEDLTRDRPAADLAARVFPDYRYSAPPFLPAEWLPRP